MSKNLLNLALISLATLSPQVLASYNQTGCFSSPGDLTLAATFAYMSIGYCEQQCGAKNSVAAVQGSDCYCGKSLPPSDTRVSDKECDMACPGYPADFCGGSKTWTVMADRTLVSNDGNSKDTTSLTVNPTVVQTATAILPGQNGKGMDSTATIPADILTAPSASFTKHPGVADATPAASSSTAASSSSAPSSAASPSASSGAAGILGAGSVLGAALVPLAMSWF
ncbi:WSC domain-containing protein [Aspergillus clavatus NRRL 1]|uniref:WSC domain protein, putative n=1 Tax=Aspergillus clavatus (strain ATCC 1007 / CBS 513.65 / DSM 816 / NCTC 3887 / NRRL 1 / QM 1276 / 107) TaxID=344612 RepID=A1CJH4_ASPCL|nr:WSC domain protein, putative [Aspergillus clavatus NRRL 1]EAW09298.1 WSC domain protein, putative [Aspergillus clavatus NRRL 1]